MDLATEHYIRLMVKKSSISIEDGDNSEAVLKKLSKYDFENANTVKFRDLLLCYDDEYYVNFHKKLDVRDVLKTLPESFIKEFQEEYSKDNCITDNMVNDGLINDICINVMKKLNTDSNKYYQDLESFIIEDLINTKCKLNSVVDFFDNQGKSQVGVIVEAVQDYNISNRLDFFYTIETAEKRFDNVLKGDIKGLVLTNNKQNEKEEKSVNKETFESFDLDSKREYLTKMIEFTLNNSKYDLWATDTHRWIETDSFYEVEFRLGKLDEEFSESLDNKDYCYLTTLSGDGNLQEEWSANNPQRANISDFIYDMDEFDLSYSFERVSNFAEKLGLKMLSSSKEETPLDTLVKQFEDAQIPKAEILQDTKEESESQKSIRKNR